MAGWSWRHRWELAPAAGTTAVFAASAASPVLSVVTGFALAGVAEGARRLSRSERRLAGRMWLSGRERRHLAVWSVGAGGWALWSALPALPGAGNLLLLLAGTAAPAWSWTRSRRPRALPPVMSPGALAVLDRWTEAVALRGPSQLQGSHILVPTMREPAEGAYAFTVQLAEGVHGQDAAAEAARRGIETQLKLPVGTASVAPDRDDATRVLVTLTPARHLEAEPQAWPGPVLLEDGGIPLAVTPDGRDVAAALFNADGVEHALIVGTTGVGKSSTTAAFALPGPAAQVETLWYLDGKEGGSAPYLEAACDWYLDDRRVWGAAVEAAHRVLLERKRRRKGKHRWHTPSETDPILTLLVDEATTVAGVLKPHQHAKLLEILREGRSLGVRVVQVAQDPMGTDLIGGRKARDLMAAGGTVVAHRMGGSQAARIALDSTSDRTVDLTGLPGEPGFAAIVRRGKVLAQVARVRFASDTAAGEAAAQVAPRPLGPEDAEAAGEAYASRAQARSPIPAGDVRKRADDVDDRDQLDGDDLDDLDGEELGDLEDGARVGTSATGEGELVAGTVRLARDVVYDALAAVGEPVNRGWIAEYTGLAPGTVSRALLDLEAEERARRAARQRWEAIT